jgi:hypothetical protein
MNAPVPQPPPAASRGHRAALFAALGVLVAGGLVTAWALGRSSNAAIDAGPAAIAALVDAAPVAVATKPPPVIDAGAPALPPPPDAGAVTVKVTTPDKKKRPDAGTATTTTTTTKPPPDAGPATATATPTGSEPVPTTMKITSPTKFDPGKFVATATRLVKKSSKDAAITMIRVPGVRSDGTVDLTTGPELEYMFVVPSRVQDPGRWCLMLVTVRGDTAHIGPGRVDDCKGYDAYHPKCTFKQILERAKAKGAPAEGTCLVQFLGNWGVRCGESFGEAFADDC